MKNTFIKALFATAALGVLASCSDDNNGTVAPIDETFNSELLVDFSTDVAQPTYTALAAKTSTLNTQIIALTTDDATDAELTAARTTWKEARQAWEQSESFLFGPVSADEIDPRIDTWPVNFTDLQGELNGDAEFTAEYIDQLDDALKGFHPIEFLIFGLDGNKKAADLKDREKEYLKALAANLKELTGELATSWNPATAGNYHEAFTKAGNGSKEYTTQVSAFTELVEAMAGICDEVANGKIGEVYVSDKPEEMEESPYAQNSIIDFTNNIKGVENVYLGKYSTDGKGLEDLVRAHNLDLDNKIKTKLSTAIQSLGKITVPFAQAVKSQAVQVQSAIDAINDLEKTLTEELLPFVQQHAK